MANVANTKKVFMFQVEINGLNQFECQKFKPPGVTIDKVEHGDTVYSVKTAGRYNIDDIVLEKIRPLPGSDTLMWDWLTASQDPIAGGGQLPSNVKQTIVVRELDTTGTLVINTWQYDGCWVCGIEQSEFDRMSSDNIIETVTISTDIGTRF